MNDPIYEYRLARGRVPALVTGSPKPRQIRVRLLCYDVGGEGWAFGQEIIVVLDAATKMPIPHEWILLEPAGFSERGVPLCSITETLDDRTVRRLKLANIREVETN